MSFFERARPPELPPQGPKPSRQDLPEWFAPPEGVIPFPSKQRAVLLQSDQIAVVADQFEVYPRGVHFRVAVQKRTPSQPARTDDGSVLYSLGGGESHLSASEAGKDVVYYGLELADGTKWNNIESPSAPRPQGDPSGPTIRSCGGGALYTDHWIWPLPPPGPIVFFAKWPKERLKERSVEIDADELRALSARAIVVWPT